VETKHLTVSEIDKEHHIQIKNTYLCIHLTFIVVHVNEVRQCLWTAATVHPPRDMSMKSHGRMILTGENQRTRKGTCPSATFSTKNSTWTDPGMNWGLCSKRSATNCLIHGTATCILYNFNELNLISFSTFLLLEKLGKWLIQRCRVFKNIPYIQLLTLLITKQSHSQDPRYPARYYEENLLAPFRILRICRSNNLKIRGEKRHQLLCYKGHKKAQHIRHRTK
jgi:hypothetical protein